MYIEKVEIKNLWGHDFVWRTIDKDVNVLIGPNGAGKSMMLRMIHEAILPVEDTELNFRLFDPIDEIIIELEDSIVVRANSEGRKITGDEFVKDDYKLNSTFIDTFDVTEKSPNPNTTLLDYQIEKLKQQFVVYQRDLSNQVEKVLTNGNSDSKSDDLDLIAKIYDTKNKFLEILDNLFSGTGKKFDEKDFFFQKIDSTQHPILPENLSSGEKQILIILLNALLQDKEKFILFMDEPEISLHIEWQRKLISYIRLINPNVQIILTTHSPTVYYQGWTEKAARIEEIQVLATAGSVIIREKTTKSEGRIQRINSDFEHFATGGMINRNFNYNFVINSYTCFTKSECIKLLKIYETNIVVPDRTTYNILISKVNNYTDGKAIFDLIGTGDDGHLFDIKPTNISLNTLMRKIDTIEQGIELIRNVNSDKKLQLYPDITTFSILMGKAKTAEEVKAIEEARNFYRIKPNEIYTNKLKFKR